MTLKTIKFKPKPGVLMVKPLTAKEISEGGIIIPAVAQKKPGIAVVVLYEPRDEYSADIAPGEKVLYPGNAGTAYLEDGVHYLLVHEEDVYLKF